MGKRFFLAAVAFFIFGIGAACEDTETIKEAPLEIVARAMLCLDRGIVELKKNITCCFSIGNDFRIRFDRDHMEDLHRIQALLDDAKKSLSKSIEFWDGVDVKNKTKKELVEEQSRIEIFTGLLKETMSYLVGCRKGYGVLGQADDIDQRKIKDAVRDMQMCSKRLFPEGSAQDSDEIVEPLIEENMVFRTLLDALNELEKGVVGRYHFVRLIINCYLSCTKPQELQQNIIVIHNFENAYKVFWRYLYGSNMRAKAMEVKGHIYTKQRTTVNWLNKREYIANEIECLLKKISASLDEMEKQRDQDAGLDVLDETMEEARKKNAELAKLCSTYKRLKMKSKAFGRELLWALGFNPIPIIPTYLEMGRFSLNDANTEDIMCVFEFRHLAARARRLKLYTRWYEERLQVLSQRIGDVRSRLDC